MPVIRIDPRHLRFIVAVAEELNLRKAADRRYLAQPALTRQIQAMESPMGVRLFDRDKRYVARTSAGRVALERCRALPKDWTTW